MDSLSPECVSVEYSTRARAPQRVSRAARRPARPATPTGAPTRRNAFIHLSRDPGFQALFAASAHQAIGAHRVVLRESPSSDRLYLITRGSVVVRQCSEGGAPVALDYRYPGDFFGEMAVLPTAGRPGAIVQTLNDSLILEVSRVRFIELGVQYPALWIALAGQLAARLRSSTRRLSELPESSAAERVWSVVVEHATRLRGDPAPDGLRLRIGREDLGRLAGCSRDAASEALRALARTGRLRLDGHSIVLPDPTLA